MLQTTEELSGFRVSGVWLLYLCILIRLQRSYESSVIARQGRVALEVNRHIMIDRLPFFQSSIRAYDSRVMEIFLILLFAVETGISRCSFIDSC
jgi:hypothetical protein